MSDKLSARLFGIFSSNAVIRDDIDKDVAVIMPLGVTTDEQNREEIERKIERKKRELGERYNHDPKNFVKRIDGRSFRRAA